MYYASTVRRHRLRGKCQSTGSWSPSSDATERGRSQRPAAAPRCAGGRRRSPARTSGIPRRARGRDLLGAASAEVGSSSFAPDLDLLDPAAEVGDGALADADDPAAPEHRRAGDVHVSGEVGR